MTAISLPRLLGLLSVLILSACATTLPEQFYSLDTVATTLPTSSNNAEFSLTVDRITLPESVDRPQIVLNGPDHTVRRMEGHRWAESLRQAIPRMVAGNLHRQFPRASIAGASDSTALAQPTYRVAMDVVRLDSRFGERVDVVVHWRLRNATGIVRDSVSTLRENTDGATYDALIAAHGKALAHLSNDIGDAIIASNSRR